jgi:hypothetical protein
MTSYSLALSLFSAFWLSCSLQYMTGLGNESFRIKTDHIHSQGAGRIRNVDLAVKRKNPKRGNTEALRCFSRADIQKQFGGLKKQAFSLILTLTPNFYERYFQRVEVSV